ncbi:DNA mismatch endonuclease Vsr [Cupriavidus sp. SZY C1]|uniref:very short patch repair endonuclease n=1 Tax=Cupriavidus sp. SZY C1 TaxID=3055037 RepID=UPI0028B98BBD|nr:DNA mismatch endonuclease Vsr [Cupriavidus sp. SZY C1]MDT6964290.1 DNA mismatch endonuclease Vsr [Cupriavidus sp. SZY C1]
MVDVVSAEIRSRMMAGIRGKNTRPEMRLRRFLHKAGFRYRLHDRSLPGTPDVVLPRYRTAILIHGCFWHRHANCRFATTPATNAEFWKRKFSCNVERDSLAVEKLLSEGWRVIVVWECGLKSAAAEQSLDWLPGYISNGSARFLEWPITT